jgi:hypothetical protein
MVVSWISSVVHAKEKLFTYQDVRSKILDEVGKRNASRTYSCQPDRLVSTCADPCGTQAAAWLHERPIEELGAIGSSHHKPALCEDRCEE